MSYSIEQKVRAKDLFVESGLTYDQIAKETKISVDTLKTWGAEGKWRKERDEYEETILELNGKVHKLKVKLVNGAIDTGDPQKIYALANLLRATAGAKGAPQQQDEAAMFLGWLSQLTAFLKDRDQEALRYLQPHLRAFTDTVKSGAALQEA